VVEEPVRGGLGEGEEEEDDGSSAHDGADGKVEVGAVRGDFYVGVAGDAGVRVQGVVTGHGGGGEGRRQGRRDRVEVGPRC